jgi:hypothetical protein
MENLVPAPFSKNYRNILSLFNIVHEGDVTFLFLAVIGPPTTERRQKS